jgi:hypothetical protein
MMGGQDNNTANQSVQKTYSPTVSGNYQPVISPAAASQQATPPIGDSGVPPARNGGTGGAAPSAKTISSGATWGAGPSARNTPSE